MKFPPKTCAAALAAVALVGSACTVDEPALDDAAEATAPNAIDISGPVRTAHENGITGIDISKLQGISAETLRDTMRQLWTDHAFWTRVYVIDTIAGLPDADAAAARLFRNQKDIANAIRPFYGDDAAARLEALLDTHILGASAVLTAAMSGDPKELDQATAEWFANAHDIAAFLASANPNWDQDALDAMMVDHLNATTDEVTARLDGRWKDDAQAYDVILAQLRNMADTLAFGLGKQFPNTVRPATAPKATEHLHVVLRNLWEDHVEWTRLFIIEDMAGLDSVGSTTDRLLQNQADIGAAFGQYFGMESGTKLADLLRAHILGAADLLHAAEKGDAVMVEKKTAEWFQNAHEIAVFINSQDPLLPVDQLDEMMKTHLTQTLLEVKARLGADWKSDVGEYDLIEQHILKMSDTLTYGISKYQGMLRAISKIHFPG